MEQCIRLRFSIFTLLALLFVNAANAVVSKESGRYDCSIHYGEDWMTDPTINFSWNLDEYEGRVNFEYQGKSYQAWVSSNGCQPAFFHMGVQQIKPQLDLLGFYRSYDLRPSATSLQHGEFRKGKFGFVFDCRKIEDGTSPKN